MLCRPDSATSLSQSIENQISSFFNFDPSIENPNSWRFDRPRIDLQRQNPQSKPRNCSLNPPFPSQFFFLRSTLLGSDHRIQRLWFVPIGGFVLRSIFQLSLSLYWLS